MTKNISQEQVAQMFNSISPVYDKINRVLSFGIDKRWRKKMGRFLPPGENLRLLDLATGTGDQLLSLMRTGKIDKALGIDVAEEMLHVGKQKIDLSPYASKVELKVGSALETGEEGNSFDCATITFGIRNTESPLLCLKEMFRLLTPGGRAIILEFSLPNNRMIRGIHILYLRHVLPWIGGLLSGKKMAYSYLNRTIESFPYGDSFCKLMEEAGFSTPTAIPLTFGVATLYVGVKR